MYNVIFVEGCYDYWGTREACSRNNSMIYRKLLKGMRRLSYPFIIQK